MSDIVLINDEPYNLVTAFKISQKIRNIVPQNIILAFVVKAVILLLVVVSIATICEAVD